MTTPYDVGVYLQRVDEAVQIINSNASWETKYHLIFSDRISITLSSIFSLDNYYDPDTTYEEDVTAYVNAIREKAAELRKAFDL